MQKHKSTILI